MTQSECLARLQRSILIADDEPNILILMEQVLEELEEEGVKLFLVNNGTDALSTLVAQRPALVFLDVMMPELSGFEVCRLVKDNPDLQSIYIVLLTAKGQAFDHEQGMAVGADCYMTKPFRPKEILTKARRILQRQAGN
ncbi:response regulator [Synechocystis sp. LKSZ1]|uniref:response regulator transcription factor n=1 Tax=Synechocystis sp. LKSZ1 TaxID=3144951 RepID=UPI00336BB679